MLKYLRPDQLWINPDCGLKTRAWAETLKALQNSKRLNFTPVKSSC